MLEDTFFHFTAIVNCKGVLTLPVLKGGKMDQSPHKSEFVDVKGVKLHYLDWGGTGQTLLFLAGMGCNAHVFDEFAPRFTDRFHVLALTRRGHGESDHPDNGYDIETLTEDIRQFLDDLNIKKVILAGHSLAGMELSHFAASYPERILNLVYLDAAYDRSNAAYKNFIEKNPLPKMQPSDQKESFYSVEEYFASIRKAYPGLAAIWDESMQSQSLHEITLTTEGKVVDRMSDAIGAALMQAMTTYVPEDAKVKAPTLGIYAISNGRYYIAEWMTEEQKMQVHEFFETVNDPWQAENIQIFKQNIPHAKVVEIPEGHHYCFLKNPDRVFEEMREFLLNPG
jgi:non-heme chloroperoxidase